MAGLRIRAVAGVLAVLLILASCSREPPAATSRTETPLEAFGAVRKPEVLVTGAALSGANGLDFGPDGLLHVASVIGSEIVVMDPRDGAVRRRLTTLDGVNSPDDLAFGPDGSLFWTSILTGEVVGFDASGRRVVAGTPGVGVNPITFAADGRLFVAQCFFGSGVYEVDPSGATEPRLITADLGPGCGLNGMDWGSDGRLYGPRWFAGEVVSVDVSTGEHRVEASGFQVPAAVKFDGRGDLHVLDAATGQVLRLEDTGPVEVTRLTPGLDNLAFDLRNRLYVSSFADAFVVRVEPDGTAVELAPGGMAHPGGVAVLTETAQGRPEVVVADLHALRGFDAETGAPTFVERTIPGVGEMGSVLEVEADGANLILTSFVDNSVRVWDPRKRQVTERYDGLLQPVSALRYRGELVVAEHGSRRVIAVGPNGTRVIAADLRAPGGLATNGSSLFVTDRDRGRIFEIARDGDPIPKRRVMKKLHAPEGLAVHRDGLVVVEGESGRIMRVADGAATLVALIAPGTPPVSPAQPPSMVFNDVAALGDILYATGESNRVLYRIDLGGPPVVAGAPDSAAPTEPAADERADRDDAEPSK